MDLSPKYDIPWELITESFTARLLPDDEQKLNNWLLSDPGNKEKYSRLREVWETSMDDYKFYEQADESTAWTNLSAKLKQDKTISHDSLFKIGRNQFIRNFSAIAAGLLILITVGYLVFSHNNNVVYKTAAGEQREIKLLDGSEVSLKPQSRIKVAQNFNKASRTISLEEGEAAFDVFHRDKPFIVKVGPVRIEDLGTSFVIKKDKEKIDVAVNSGKIAFIINATNEIKELTAGESITFNINGKNSGNVNYSNSGTITQTALLNFDNSPLSEVIVSVQKIYKNKIVIADSAIGEKRLTADFDGVSFENVIAIICKSLNLEYSVNDSSYLLIEKRKE
jgi:transmembrane sensor